MDENKLRKFDSTFQGMHQFHIYRYRGNTGCPEILVSCPDERAADAGRRLLNMPSYVEKLRSGETTTRTVRATVCRCGFIHGPGDRCGPF